jgi:hypothetical protein
MYTANGPVVTLHLVAGFIPIPPILFHGKPGTGRAYGDPTAKGEILRTCSPARVTHLICTTHALSQPCRVDENTGSARPDWPKSSGWGGSRRARHHAPRRSVPLLPAERAAERKKREKRRPCPAWLGSEARTMNQTGRSLARVDRDGHVHHAAARFALSPRTIPPPPRMDGWTYL